MSTLAVSSVAFDTSVSGHVKVTFNQSVDATDAATTGNFSIPGVTVTAASYSSNVTTLTVTGWKYGTSYTCTVTGVRDAGHTQTIANPNNFYGFYLGAGNMGAGSESYSVPNELAKNIAHAVRNFNTDSTPFGSSGSVRQQGSKLNAGVN